MTNIRPILPPYLVPEMSEMSRIDEPVMYPYSEDIFRVGIGSQAELEKWRLVDVSWCVQDQSQLEHTRYYFGYVGVRQSAMLFGRKVFTGYVLLESRYDQEIENYAEPDEMWVIYLWAYKGNLSNTRKYELALRMLWRHWVYKKKKDEETCLSRNLCSTHLHKKERLLNNQVREIARWVWV